MPSEPPVLGSKVQLPFIKQQHLMASSPVGPDCVIAVRRSTKRHLVLL